MPEDTLIYSICWVVKQCLLPNENDPSGSCNSKTEFIPYTYLYYIYWKTLPGEMFVKWHVPVHSLSFEVGLVWDEVVEPRKVFRFALLFCSWEVSVYSCSVHPILTEWPCLFCNRLLHFLWMLIDIYRSRGYSTLGFDVMSSTQKKWLGRRRRLSQKQAKQSHDWGCYRHTSAMVEICSDPRLLFQVDLVLEH